MKFNNTDLVYKLRTPRKLHYFVVIISASVITFLYYVYKDSIPTPPGHWLEWFWSIFYFEFRNNVIGVLLNAPLLYATLTLGWKRASIILLILLVCIAPYIINFSFNSYTLFMSFGVLLLPAIIIISSEIKIIADKKERMALVEKEIERAEFMRQMFNMQENDRKRIAQELHDGITQTILVNASLVRNLAKAHTIDYIVLEKELKTVEGNSLTMVDEIRRICRDLRPSILDNLGLVSAIKWLIESLHEETGIAVEFSLAGSIYELMPDESAALFRIVQETLSNVKRHAEANMVHISIEFLDTGVSIQIKDNGTGFDLPENVSRLTRTGKLGILGMHERAQSIGAILQIQSNVGSGTEVRISIERNKTGRFPATIV